MLLFEGKIIDSETEIFVRTLVVILQFFYFTVLGFCNPRPIYWLYLYNLRFLMQLCKIRKLVD